MLIKQAIQNIRKIKYKNEQSPALETTARKFISQIPGAFAESVSSMNHDESAGTFNIAVASAEELQKLRVTKAEIPLDNFIFFNIRKDGSGFLIVSKPYFLFSFASHIFDNLLDTDIEDFASGKFITPAFDWQRVSYDYFLTQEGRIQRNFDRESYVRELARLGFTHLEVNGLGFPMGIETGPKGEIYPMFYTYCPALDQFVYSELNKGLYPNYYLSANMKYLKENVRLAKEYGLVPGILSFEPRSVPEKFFDKYPMLRGGRIDHPFRSFIPRYTMTITHPKVRAHYAEMMQKLMHEVPELEFFNVWTNDSGAGFEHTKSLYVGRNGGPYLIREWKNDDEIAQLAGENALRFFHTLRDAAREVNPDFRVITRLESFYGEHDTVWEGLGKGVDVEATSLIARGWDSPYAHPRYKDVRDVNGGTIYQADFNERETQLLSDIEDRDGRAHFYFATGPHSMFEPLLGVPYPGLTFGKLKAMYDGNVNNLAMCGGAFPPDLVPYNPNHEIVRQFQFDAGMDIKKVVNDLAKRWAGDEFGEILAKAWNYTEDAIVAYPNITSLYSTFGFTWYRLWLRPFVPNIEALPQKDRNYYEEFMCTTPHNPNNVDLSRDVLFQLTTPEKSLRDIERIDENLMEPIEEAIEMLQNIEQAAISKLSKKNVISDQLVRIRALRCWFVTSRSVAAWVAGVYGYMAAQNDTEKDNAKAILDKMTDMEIANTEELIELVNSGVEFMAITDQGETPLIYGSNFADLLPRRIELMQKHRDDEPFIDHNYVERKAGEMI
ncbi:MAG: hypothetical protein HN356_09020 [Calditrichaeota bacterium]|nr:hypothetical protein [Calditrichota bacterium]